LYGEQFVQSAPRVTDLPPASSVVPGP